MRQWARLGALVMGLTVAAAAPARAQVVAVWLAPADNRAAAKADDFPRLFTNPGGWANAARQTATLSLTADYVMHAPDPQVKAALAFLANSNIRLDVSVAALAAGQTACGAQGAALLPAAQTQALVQRLQGLGAEVGSFSFVMPLTIGHFAQGAAACRLSVDDAAQHLVAAAKVLRAAYPVAAFVDEETPLGIAVNRWMHDLNTWLVDFAQATGENLYGITLDIRWASPWQDVTRQTQQLLQSRVMHLGLLMQADARPGLSATAWAAETRRHACDVIAALVSADFVELTNWRAPQVKLLPESDGNTLTGLVDWYSEGPVCLPTLIAPPASP